MREMMCYFPQSIKHLIAAIIYQIYHVTTAVSPDGQKKTRPNQFDNRVTESVRSPHPAEHMNKSIYCIDHIMFAYSFFLTISRSSAAAFPHSSTDSPLVKSIEYT